MRTTAVSVLVPSLLLFASPAYAHFHLDEPPSAVVESVQGDPQKPSSLADACPAGTASGLATQVQAGGKLRVKVTETIGHGGHYRVAFAKAASDFSFPDTTVESNQCISTTVQSSPALPVLADGLFEHTQDQANAKKICDDSPTCETDVTVPDVPPGEYVLQVIQWMTPHGSAANNGAHGCFYAHCATIQVVADAPDDGGVVTVDAGSQGTDAGQPDAGSDDGGAGGSGRSRTLTSSDASDDGCAVGSASGASAWAPFAGVVAALGALRRRPKRRA